MTKGIKVKKADDISEWYTEAITKGDIADYSDVSGCMIFKPYCYAIWERMQQEVDRRFKKIGLQNCYFPLFIPERFLNKEADHVEGFAPEVAWVTAAGNSEFSERLAIRPTSETIMYPTYAKWIRSWRDLPMRLNQWNNVVRWEFKNPVPLLRSREFLWNEGHTVFATKEEAEAERDEILGAYEEVITEYMAIYGEKGYKSEKEKFAGAEYTCSIESFLESGKAIQGPDFHHDGQKFAKAFDITYVDKDENRQYVWQNTFAITTRMIGVMIMMHGDDKGLVIPPYIAPTQVVIVPIFTEENKDSVLKGARDLLPGLEEFRVELDDSEGYTPGWKFNQHELKGIPLRIEIGPKDIEKGSVVMVRRDMSEKEEVPMKELATRIHTVLEDIHTSLFERSKANFEKSVEETKDFEELKRIVDDKRMALSPFCDEPECEDEIKAAAPGVTTRCSPFDALADEGDVCVKCGKPAKRKFYFARAY